MRLFRLTLPEHQAFMSRRNSCPQDSKVYGLLLLLQSLRPDCCGSVAISEGQGNNLLNGILPSGPVRNWWGGKAALTRVLTWYNLKAQTWLIPEWMIYQVHDLNWRSNIPRDQSQSAIKNMNLKFWTTILSQHMLHSELSQLLANAAALNSRIYSQ